MDGNTESNQGKLSCQELTNYRTMRNPVFFLFFLKLLAPRLPFKEKSHREGSWSVLVGVPA